MKFERSSGNVFRDIGFDAIEAEELAAKSDLVALLRREIDRRGLTQTAAARLCGIDQPTLSKVMNGRLESVTIDRLAKWIVCLGCIIEINVRQPRSRSAARKGSMSVRTA